MNQFFGPLDDLKTAVAACSLNGDWTESQNGLHSFRGKTGEVLNWWPSKGTIQFQGKNQHQFRDLLAASVGAEPKPKTIPVSERPKIFVVHGHDREARDQLELVLRRLGLEPFILQNSGGSSQTIIEALEQNIYREAAFGIVLMTPDDYGYAKTESDAERKPRARQNVILELGMVMAALGRSRMAILQKGVLERPSDTDGILRIEFNDHVREIVPKLVQRLQVAGFQISGEMIATASA